MSDLALVVPSGLGLAEAVEAKNSRGPSTRNASFPIVQTNSYGRMMIDKSMETHENLISNCKSRTDSWISRVA